VGLVREVESEVARSEPSLRKLQTTLCGWAEEEVAGAVETLLAEGRIVRDKSRLKVSPRYVVLSSDAFHHRVDALNHFLGGVTRAVSQRLIFEERDEAMLKTISFSARPERLQSLLRELEGHLRREIAAAEEDAQFAGEGRRYVLGICAAREGSGEP
jgi:hypothetical protein